MKLGLTKTTSLFLSSTLVLSFALTSCDKAKDRPNTVNSKIAGNLVSISSVHDVTNDKSKSYFYKNSENAEIKKIDTTPQVKLDDDDNKILAKVTEQNAKTLIDQQLQNGLISFMITETDIKIYAVINANNTTAAKTVDADSSALLTFKDLLVIKKSEALIDATVSENLKEQIKFVELASVKIEKVGILENEKTDYNEKISTLNIVERPIDLSTHILLHEETTTEQQKPL